MNDILSVRGLTKHFGAKTAVHGLELALQPGEILGFLGPNGSGKTTTIKMICGLLRPTAGSVFFAGEPVRQFADIASQIGVLIDPVFPTYLNGRQVLHIAAHLRNVVKTEAERLLDFVELSQAGDVQVGNYSFGMRMRLGLAIAMLGQPKVLLMDEPTVGLDPSGQTAFIERLQTLREQGVAVLFSSHQLEEVRLLCDRVAYIHNGELQFVLPTEELEQKDEIHLHVQPVIDETANPLTISLRLEMDGNRTNVIVQKTHLSQALTELIQGGYRVIDVRNGRSALWQVFQEDEKEEA